MKVALLGDSHAKVTFRSLIPLLKKAGDSVVYERAENGWSLKRHIANGSIRRLRESKPDFIILSLGGNNSDTKTDSYKGTVDTLLNIEATKVFFLATQLFKTELQVSLLRFSRIVY